MRPLVLAIVAILTALGPLLGPPATARAQVASDLLPKESDLTGMLAPLTINNFKQVPGTDGWDSNQSFEIAGVPDGKVLASLDASVLPTDEGAAGFLQTKLQQLRDQARKENLLGDVTPATAELTQDADEAYFAVFVSPEGTPNRAILAFLISRYGSQVTSVSTAVLIEGPGTIPESAQQAAGVVLGLLARQLNDLAGDD